MHASVQHEPFTSHSMFIKVASRLYDTLRPENKHSVTHGASRFEVFLLHALAFLDSYKSHHRCEQFGFIQTCFGVAMRKIYTEDS